MYLQRAARIAMCLIIIIISLFNLGSIYSTDIVTIGFALPSAKSGKTGV